jgi:hypothetical protein
LCSFLSSRRSIFLSSDRFQDTSQCFSRWECDKS